jgi:hypothetical protein
MKNFPAEHSAESGHRVPIDSLPRWLVIYFTIEDSVGFCGSIKITSLK